MAWGGIIEKRLVGPFFFENGVTSASYLEMLQNFAIPELLRLGFDPGQVIYAHDGAASHSTLEVRNFLTRNFEGFIGRGIGALIPWPPRSPDFNPCDIFLWAYTKHLCYQERAQDIDELRAKIDESFDNVTEDMLVNVHQNLVKRLNMCINVNGDIFEHILNG